MTAQQPPTGLTFTPWNEDKTKRLSFKTEEITVVDGALLTNGRGKQATVEIDGKTYEVFGEPCGLGCRCDARIVEVK